MKNMNRFERMMLTCGLLLATACIAQAQSPEPRIVVDEPTYNFGEKSNSQIIDHTFVIRNEGDMTLLIENIRSSCGCTVGKVSSREIEPNGQSEIQAKFNLRGRNGRQRSVLTLETNDPKQPRTRLTLEGVAVQGVQVRPHRLFFGQVHAGSPTVRDVEIIGLPDQPFELSETEVGTPHFSVESTETISPHHHRVTVHAQPPNKPGLIQDVLRIRTTHPDHPMIQVPVHAQVTGALAVAPKAITLMGGNPNPVTRYVVVRPGAVRNFEVTGVTPPSADMRVTVLTMPNQGYRIQLMNVVATPELHGKSLRIETNLADEPYLEVPFEIIEPQS